MNARVLIFTKATAITLALPLPLVFLLFLLVVVYVVFLVTLSTLLYCVPFQIYNDDAIDNILYLPSLNWYIVFLFLLVLHIYVWILIYHLLFLIPFFPVAFGHEHNIDSFYSILHFYIVFLVM